MQFKNFTIHATPHIAEAHCQCGNKLHEVSNGFLSVALFCPKCEDVYQLKLIKTPKKDISAEFLKQCREEVSKKTK